ncbi:TadE/TadG family type IV pilus assembly protein [Arthrobacter sp. QXT-31]|uniref:TadE/TadG family type IV pilus assembly protein n=1 Tax=Arthrobacter sp. QXT-31 TaxID=1357915 RepID=UPI000971867F|nr:TadE/TadG family type IV pilus assembly protein [Arthrobacter sp. QXT-31]APX03138.1 pilus assembly protein TadE [Arthrobacter sp. QXT-31]
MAQVSERGAVAVEFAILAPVLIMILLGIMEFGRAYNVQTTLTNSARESVRAMAINNSQASAKTAAKNAAAQLSPALADSNISFSAANCTVGSQVTVTISYNLSTMTGIAGPFAMTGRGTMLCGG